MDKIQTCPNCYRLATEAYKKGYADAMALTEKEIVKAQQSRPIQIVVPKDAQIIPDKDDDD